MAPIQSTYGLTLTRAQADYLLRLVTIAELAIAEDNRNNWVPSGHGDAALMQTQLQATRGAVSLEKPLRDLATWLKQHEQQPPGHSTQSAWASGSYLRVFSSIFALHSSV